MVRNSSRPGHAWRSRMPRGEDKAEDTAVEKTKGAVVGRSAPPAEEDDTRSGNFGKVFCAEV